MDILKQFEGKINGTLETFDRVIINAQEYLSRLLEIEGIPFSMYNNSFSYIEDFEKAQGLAGRVLNKKSSDSS